MNFKAGDRIYSPNGNAGTVVGYMTKDSAFLAIKLDNGRQVSGHADDCQHIPEVINYDHPNPKITNHAGTTGAWIFEVQHRNAVTYVIRYTDGSYAHLDWQTGVRFDPDPADASLREICVASFMAEHLGRKC